MSRRKRCSPLDVKCIPSLEKQSLSALEDKEGRGIKWTLLRGVIRDGNIPLEDTVKVALIPSGSLAP